MLKRRSMLMLISLMTVLCFSFVSAAWYSPFVDFFDSFGDDGTAYSKITGMAVDGPDYTGDDGGTIETLGGTEDVIEIDSCQVLDIKDATYVLNKSLNGAEVTDKCFEIQGRGVTLDCRGNSIINHDLKGTVIYMNAWVSVVENCHVEAYLEESMGYEDSIGIFSAWSNRAIIRNNVVKHVGSGIYVYSENNLIEGNTVENAMKGIRVRKEGNVVSDNAVSDNAVGQGWGFEAWKAPNTVFVDNKGYNNKYGLIIKQSSGTNVSCSEFLNSGVNDVYFYPNTSISPNSNIGFWGVTYGNIIQEEGQVIVYSEECEEDIECVDGCEIGQECINNVCRGLVSRWGFEGDATDSVGDNDGTSMGDVNLNAIDSHRDGVAVFDGVDDQVVVSEFDHGIMKKGHESDSWSISVWLKPGGQNGTSNMVVGRAGLHSGISVDDDSSSIGFQLYEGSSRRLLSWTPSIFSDWHHVVAVYDNREMKLYAEGDLEPVASGTFSADLEFVDYSNDMYLGGIGTYSFKGLMDDVQIYDVALDAQDVNDLYNEGLAVCPDSKCSGCVDNNCGGLVGRWGFEGDATDSVGDNDGTSMGDVNLNAINSHRGNVAVFDGVDDYIGIGEPSALSPHEKKEWTIAAWVNPSEAKEMYIINKGWEYYSISSESDKIRAHFYSWDGTNIDDFNGESIFSNTPLPIDEWTFVVLSVNFNEGVARLYYNEVVEEIALNKAESMYAPWEDQLIYIGAYQYHDYGGGTYAPGSFFSGSIDDVMIYDYALGIDEVNNLYNEGLAVCPNSKCNGCVNDEDCDDGNTCTTESCVGSSEDSKRCLFEFNTNSCDDLINCTENDVCFEGSCSGAPNDNLCESHESCFSDVGCDQSSCSSCEDCDGWFFDECYYDECHNSCGSDSSCYFKGVIFGENCVELDSVCGSSVLECGDYSDEECLDNPCSVGNGCVLDEGACVDASLSSIEISLSILGEEYYLGDPVKLSYVSEGGETGVPKSAPKELVLSSEDVKKNVQTTEPDLTAPHVEGEILIMLENGVAIDVLDDLNDKYGVDIIEKIPNEFEVILEDIYKLQIEEADLENALKEYGKKEGVLYAELNYYAYGASVPSDTRYSEQWAHQTTDAEAGWDVETGNSDITIAIIDTGVDYTHEDLAGNMLADCTNDCPSGTGVDYVNVVNFECDSNEDCSGSDRAPTDYHGHGTAAAGIAAGVSNNNLGISGVCQNCTIMPVRAGFADQAGNAAFEYASLENAIGYSASRSAVDIISIGFSGPASGILESRIIMAHNNGKIIIASAGNGNNDTPTYPAAYENVIAVGASDESDLRASFSNYGSWVDIAAPGTNILSTVPLAGVNSDATGYMSLDGTSMSAAYVSGIVGLLLSKNSNLVQSEISSILRQSGDSITTDEYIGDKRVNINNSLIISLQSKIVNNGDSDMSGNLTMILQRKVGENWENEETGFSNLEIVVPSSGLVQLNDGFDNLGNSVFNGWNSLNVIPDFTGGYRVYTVFDFNGQIVETLWEFEVIPTCSDNSKNQNETDVDCGGDNCEGCEIGLDCLVDGDCLLGNCDAGFCADPVALDVTMSVATQKNFYEIGGKATLN